jgi:hypothetical protein
MLCCLLCLRCQQFCRLTVRFLKFSKSAVSRSSWSLLADRLPSSASALDATPAGGNRMRPNVKVQLRQVTAWLVVHMHDQDQASNAGGSE